mgnify:CR=1 FL=1
MERNEVKRNEAKRSEVKRSEINVTNKELLKSLHNIDCFNHTFTPIIHLEKVVQTMLQDQLILLTITIGLICQ